MNTKHYLFLILLFFVFKLTLAQITYQKNSNGKKYVTMITSRFVDLDIETFADVKCSDFEASFANSQVKVIKDSIKINQIINLLRFLKTAGKDYYQNVDTRVKVELKYNNDSVETICMDRFIVDRNNHILLNSDSLKYLLTDKIRITRLLIRN